MATYEPQHISARNLLLTANSQNNYGVAIPDANLLERARFDGNAFASINPSFWSDGELAGRGHEFPTERPLIMWETGMQMSRHVDDWLAGWMIAQVLQGYSVSGAGPYIHVFKPASASRQAKATTVYFEDSAVIKYRLLDLVGTELTITIPENGPVTMQISLQGSGRFTDGVLGNAVPALAARTLLLGSDADFLIGASGAAASVKNRWRASAQIKITREIEIHRAPGGGLYALQANIDKQRAGFTIMLRAKDTEDAAEPRIADDREHAARSAAERELGRGGEAVHEVPEHVHPHDAEHGRPVFVLADRGRRPGTGEADRQRERHRRSDGDELAGDVPGRSVSYRVIGSSVHRVIRNSVRKGGRGESPEPLVGRGLTAKQGDLERNSSLSASARGPADETAN
jgi:hypothetical protein